LTFLFSLIQISKKPKSVEEKAVLE